MLLAALEVGMKNMFLCAAVVVLSCGFAYGQAQYKVLYTFAGGATGGNPVGDLVFDRSGNLYGTTPSGGSSGSPACIHGCGIVFELSPQQNGTWTETVLYNFCVNYSGQSCPDGSGPQAGIVLDSAGNLYGTTESGGSNTALICNGECGTVFELSPPSSQGQPWTETVLYSFCANQVNSQCLDGYAPESQLIFDSSGNLYGTTPGGGGGGGGTVFELSPSTSGWTEQVLYSFCTMGEGSFCPDGLGPLAGVTFDKAGNLYGTTEEGGNLKSQFGGTIYELSPTSGGWVENVVFAFPPHNEGGTPLGTVSIDPLGNLYTTFSAGGQYGYGGVGEVAATGRIREFSFDGNDGGAPWAGVLVDFGRAVLYGTASGRGTNNYGVVFQISAITGESTLHSFCSQPNCTDGYQPLAGLTTDKSGNLYGTTNLGGAHQYGVVFEITP
jgi:uncharacterized repeat protein (TIGR03803 family)